MAAEAMVKVSCTSGRGRLSDALQQHAHQQLAGGLCFDQGTLAMVALSIDNIASVLVQGFKSVNLSI